MAPLLYQIFDTALGACAVLWRDALIMRIMLPAMREDHLLAAIARAHPSAEESTPPAPVSAIIAKIAALTHGAPQDFAGAPLDRAAIEPFAARVYAALEKVGFGETTTYGAIAGELGDRTLSRAVGAALGANPFPIVIPCHRVLGAQGAIGGFSAPGGAGAKRRLLEIEGAFAASKLPLFAR